LSRGYIDWKKGEMKKFGVWINDKRSKQLSYFIFDRRHECLVSLYFIEWKIYAFIRCFTHILRSERSHEVDSTIIKIKVACNHMKYSSNRLVTFKRYANEVSILLVTSQF